MTSEDAATPPESVLRQNLAQEQGARQRQVEAVSREPLERLEAEILKCTAEIEDAERGAQQAVASEDGEAAASAWQRKRLLSNRLSDLHTQRQQLSQEIQSQFYQHMLALKLEHEAVFTDLIEEQQEVLQEAADLAVRFTTAAKRIREITEKWQRLQASWKEKVDFVLQEAGTTLDTVVPAIERHFEPLQPWASLELPDAEVRRTCWSVYNVDTGKMVETLAELKQVLARWLPLLPTDEERLRRFLVLYNTGPMPQRLKEELRQAGFSVAS